MNDSLIKRLSDIIAEGPQVGEGVAQFRSRIQGTEVELEKALEGSHNFFASALGNSATKVEIFAAPCDLELTEVFGRRAGASVNAASATLIADVGGSNANPLSAASIDIDGLTDNTTTDQALSATVANRQMKKGELLKCTWATDGSGTVTDAIVGLKYKKLAAGQL